MPVLFKDGSSGLVSFIVNRTTETLAYKPDLHEYFGHACFWFCAGAIAFKIWLDLS